MEEECGEWLRGVVLDDGRAGVFPRCFVSLRAPPRSVTASRGATSPRKPLPTPPPAGSKTRTDRATSGAGVVQGIVGRAAVAPVALPTMNGAGRRVSPRGSPREDRADSLDGGGDRIQPVPIAERSPRSDSMDRTGDDAAMPSPRRDPRGPLWRSSPEVSEANRVRTKSSAVVSLNMGRKTSVSPPTTPRKDSQHSRSSASGGTSNNADPVMQELVTVLHEWSALMWSSYAEHNMFRYAELKDRLYTLRSWHVRILNPGLPVQVRDAIKGQVVDKIEKGKRAMKLDVMAKNKSGAVMTDNNTPIATLFQAVRQLKQEKKKRQGHEGSVMANTIRKIQMRSSGESGPTPATSVLPEQSSGVGGGGVNLLLRMSACVLGLGEPVHLAFMLWKKTEVMSDTFWVHLDAKSMPESPKYTGEMGNVRTVFRDLRESDLFSGDMWLVCRITRFGLLSLEKKGKVECRRPVGMAAVQLNKQLFKNASASVETSMDIYSCPLEHQFGAMQDLLVASVDRSGLVVVPKTHPIKVSLQMLSAGGDMDVMEAHKFISAERIAVTERAISARSERRTNRLLITLCSCEGVTPDKSIEVVVEALDGEGKEIANAFMVAGGRSDFRSWVMKRTANPVWRETVVLNLDSVSPATTTLLFTLNHITKMKMVCLGCAVLQLTTPDGTVLGNATHLCHVHKMPKKKADVKSLSQQSEAAQNKSRGMGGPLANSGNVVIAAAQGSCVFSVATRLDSTELSQNASMYALLQWKAEARQLRDTLSRFMYVEQAEMVRFLPDALGSLLEIMGQVSEPDVMEASFYCLIHILMTLLDDRNTTLSSGDGQENLRNLLDKYVQLQFVSTTADQKLTECLIKAFENPLANKKRLVGVLKAMGYLLVFIQRSVELRIGRRPDFNALEGCRERLKNVFQAVCRLLAIQNLQLLSVQATAVRSIALWIVHLKLIFPPDELAKLVGQMLSSIPAASGEKAQNLTAEKLGLVYQLAVSPDAVFLESSARGEYFSIIETQLQLCVSSTIAAEKSFARLVLTGLMEPLQAPPLGMDGLPDEATRLMPYVVKTMEQTEANDVEGLIEGATVFLFYFFRMAPAQFVALFKDNMAFYSQCLRHVDRLVNKPVYDSTWFALVMFQFNAIFRFLELSQEIFPLLSVKLLNGLTHICLSVISSPSLDMNQFSQTKRSMVEEIYGDMRVRGLHFLKAAFEALESKAVGSVTKKLVPVYLQMLLVNQAEITLVGGNYLWNAVKSELVGTGAFLDVLTCVIDVMGQPRAVAKNLGYRLVRLLQKRFLSHPDLSEVGIELMSCIGEFEELLKSIHLLPPTPDYDVERTMAMLSLLNYLSQAQSSSYNSYALQLLLQNLKANQLAEAAAVLLRMADNLSWSTVMWVEPMETVWGTHPPFPEEPSKTRKERMISDAVSLLEKDSQYEKAIAVLTEQREDGRDTAALAERVNALTQKMIVEDRLVSEYFRVGFFGRGFGSLNRVALVFRGALLERLDEFNARMQQQFPTAVLLSFTSEVSADVSESEGQHLQIFRVFPSRKDDMECMRVGPDLSIPPSIRRFRRYNDVDVFMYERPVKKGRSGSEVADLWVEQTFFATDMVLPNIARFAVVTHTSTREISPLELAVKTMADKNTDLMDALATFGGPNRPSDAQPFISLVQGVVDAAVGGGFRVYQDVFFSTKYGEWDIEVAARINVLIDEQVRLMADALALWPRICPPTFAPLLEHLQSQFSVLKK